MGRWLLAVLMNDAAAKARHKLRAGIVSGQNDDEPAVMQAVFELAVQRRFGETYDVRAVTALVAAMLALATPGHDLTLLESEALIRSALGEEDVSVRGISRKIVLENYVTVLTYLCVVVLKLDVRSMSELILEGEGIARERGWNPPLAT